MNARISREFSFQAAIHFDESFILNFYHLDLMMDVTTEDIREQNIALDRIKFIITMCLDSCIFIDHKEIKAIDAYSKAGIKVCPLPEEPYDQVVASVLLSKFNTVTEKHLYINEIRIRSNICDDVSFYIGDDENEEFKNLKDCWWTENSPNISLNTKRTKKDKIVELKKEPMDWNSIGLGWKESISFKNKGEIVFIPTEK